jgi:hypothetical protein
MMKFELTWHGPVRDVFYSVEAYTQEEAIQRLQLYLCDPDDDGNNEGISELEDKA